MTAPVFLAGADEDGTASAGDLGEAAYARALDAAAGEPDPRRAAGLALEAARTALTGLGDPELGRAALDRALAHDPSAAAALALRAEVAEAAGDAGTAAGCHARLAALEADPERRARRHLRAAAVWERAGGTGRAAEAWRAALRAFPPGAAAHEVAREVLWADGPGAALEAALQEALEDAGSALDRAEAHLALGRLLAPLPDRRGEAADHLLAAAAAADAPGAVALDVLGGLHALGESWPHLARRLEADAASWTGSSPEAAARALRRLAEACLTEPPLLERAETALRHLLALEPDDVQAAEALVGVLTSQRRHREAVEVLTDLGQVARPETASLHLVRAGVLHLARFGDMAASLACFEAALGRDPTHRSAAAHLEEAYRERGRWGELARILMVQASVAASPREAAPRLREAGRLLSGRAGDPRGAARAWRALLALHPDDAEAARGLAEADDAAGELAAEPEAPAGDVDVDALLEAAEAAARLGSPARAKAFLQVARARAPENGRVRSQFLDLLADRGEHAEVRDVLRYECGRLGPDHPEWPSLMLRLAHVLLERLGDTGAGREVLAALGGHPGPDGEAARARLEALDCRLASASAHAEPAPSPPSWKAPPPDPGGLGAVHEALSRGEFEQALSLADQVAAAAPPGSPEHLEAREAAADILIDYLGDAHEGLDRLAALGRDRRLPVGLRRRVNEARVRLLERDLTAGATRDLALAEALADAAAVAARPGDARALRYRRARLLAARPETRDEAAALLEGLLADEPDNGAVFEALRALHAGAGDAEALAALLARRAARLPPGAAAAAWLELAELALEQLRDPDRADRWLARALALQPDDLAALTLRARLASTRGDPVELAEALRARIAVESDHAALPGLHYALGEALEASERPQEAAAHYQAALEGSPDAHGALLGLQRVATQLGAPEDRAALLAFCAEQARNGDEASALHEAAGRILLYELGDAAGAGRAAEAALDAEPTSYDALELLREVAQHERRPAALVAGLLRREVQLARTPKEAAGGWAELGELHLSELDDPDTALRCFEQAVSCDSEHPRALSRLARLHLVRGEGEAAHPWLERLVTVESAPREVRAWAWTRLGELHLSRGEAQAAVDDFAAAADLDPEAPRVLQGLADAAETLGLPEQALGALAKLVALGEAGRAGALREAELTRLQARRARLLAGRGRAAEAIDLWRTVLAREPGHPEALEALPALLEGRGAWAEGAEVRRRGAARISEPARRAAVLATVGERLRDRARDPAGALAVYEEAAELAPDVLGYHQAVLELARRVGRLDRARRAAFECVRLAPDGKAAADYLAAAAEAAQAAGQPDEALDLARAALERDPACVAAVERTAPALAARGEVAQAVDIWRRAIERGSGGARRRWILAAARCLAAGGEAEAAGRLAAEAVMAAPGDPTLLAALASLPPALPDAARAAADALAGRARGDFTAEAWIAGNWIARGLGQRDRAYVAAAVLAAVGALPPDLRAGLTAGRGALPEAFPGRLSPAAAAGFAPEGLAEADPFHAEAETLLSGFAHGPLAWPHPPEPGPSEPGADDLAERLGLPVDVRVHRGPVGAGLRPLTDAGILLVGADLLADRPPAERRFVLGFGLALCRPGRRWAVAAAGIDRWMQALADWAAGTADAGLALELGARFGPGALIRLEALRPPRAAPPAALRRAARLDAARFGLLAAIDVEAGLAAAFRLLAPDVPRPRSGQDAARAAAVHPLLAELLAFAGDARFLEARRALGVAVA